MQNAGTIRWHHVTLVHQSGYAPIEPIITVPDLAPGEQAELTARYPPIVQGKDSADIHSEWKLFYKGRPTSFCLQLSVKTVPGETNYISILLVIIGFFLYLYPYPSTYRKIYKDIKKLACSDWVALHNSIIATYYNHACIHK